MCLKKLGFQPLSPLQISQSLSVLPPRVVCFSSLFPCGAEVMCFGTVHLLLDKASENDLSINVPSGPLHGWYGYMSEQRPKTRGTWERGKGAVLWECVHPAGFLHRFFNCANQATKKTSLPNYSDIAVRSCETKPVKNTRKACRKHQKKYLLLHNFLNDNCLIAS